MLPFLKPIRPLKTVYKYVSKEDFCGNLKNRKE